MRASLLSPKHGLYSKPGIHNLTMNAFCADLLYAWVMSGSKWLTGAGTEIQGITWFVEGEEAIESRRACVKVHLTLEKTGCSFKTGGKKKEKTTSKNKDHIQKNENTAPSTLNIQLSVPAKLGSTVMIYRNFRTNTKHYSLWFSPL